MYETHAKSYVKNKKWFDKCENILLRPKNTLFVHKTNENACCGCGLAIFIIWTERLKLESL